ncbi:hypothetical protein COB55_02005 [Candidatus Wolfebacteria bacterium]|nr:MAG: hypothetical protein COB55_02005 [Candidatus Wolfebacteria bacterium]
MSQEKALFTVLARLRLLKAGSKHEPDVYNRISPCEHGFLDLDGNLPMSDYAMTNILFASGIDLATAIATPVPNEDELVRGSLRQSATESPA